MTGKTADRAHWDSYWEQKATNLGEWDYLSQVILQVLEEEIGLVAGKHIAEAGSGTGRISFQLAKRQARVTLVDYGLSALKLSRSPFAASHCLGDFACADISYLPFRDASFDVVWNAGVLEHSPHGKQGEIVQSLLRLCKRGGIVITLNPYSRSPIYRLGKWLLERSNRWPFGKEYPIRSIREVLFEQKVSIVSEYSVGFIVSLVESYKFLPAALRTTRIFQKLSEFCIRYADRLKPFDRFLSRMLGGYLIVSVMRNE